MDSANNITNSINDSQDEIVYNPARTRFNKTSPTNTMVIWDKAKYIPDIKAIQRKYLATQDEKLPFRKIHEASGTFNTVKIYMSDTGRKIAYRVGKDYFKRNGEFNKLLLEDNVNKDEYLQILNQSKDNIIDASKFNISPKMYYFGLMNVYHEYSNDEYQYIVQISDAYDMDLKEYFNTDANRNRTTLTKDDIYIRDQIITLLQKMTRNLLLICFDIKPPNCVINVDTKEVKLIDWDADWCQKYDKLLRPPGADSQRSKIDLLNVIIMANHFYRYCKYNIFYTYLQEEIKETDIEALKVLFCDATKGNYEYMARYYFGLDEYSYVNCKEEVFTELITRARKLRGNNDAKTGGKMRTKKRHLPNKSKSKPKPKSKPKSKSKSNHKPSRTMRKKSRM